MLKTLQRKILLIFLTKNLIQPTYVNQPNVFKFVSNQYLCIWFYFIQTTHYLASPLSQAGTDNYTSVIPSSSKSCYIFIPFYMPYPFGSSLVWSSCPINNKVINDLPYHHIYTCFRHPDVFVLAGYSLSIKYKRIMKKF